MSGLYLVVSTKMYYITEVNQVIKSVSQEFNNHDNLAKSRRFYVKVFLDKEDV